MPLKSESGSFTHYGYDEYGRVEKVIANHDVENLDANSPAEALLPAEATITTTEYNHDSQVMETESHYAGGLPNTSVQIRDGFGRVVQALDFETGYYSTTAFNDKAQAFDSKTFSNNHKLLGHTTNTYYPGDGSLKRTTNNITGAFSENEIDEDINRVKTTLGGQEISDPQINISNYTNTGSLTNGSGGGIGFTAESTHFGDTTKVYPEGGQAMALERKVSSSGYTLETTQPELNNSKTIIEPSAAGSPGKVTDGAGKVFENTLNEAGETVTSTDAKGDAVQRSTHSYVNNAERISLLLRNDQLTETRYDLAGRVEEVRYYYGVTPSDLQTWTRAQGNSAGAITTSCTYDSLGRKLEYKYKDGEVHRYIYYPRSESAQKLDRIKEVCRVMPGGALKILKSFDEYDLFGNATNVKEYRNGENNSYSETITSYYGGTNGQESSAETFGFGKLKDSTSCIVSQGVEISSAQTLSMTYDSLGRAKTKTTPSGDSLAYNWDFTFVPKQITLNGSNLVSYDRTSPYKGNVTGKTVLGSVNISKTYNSHSAGLPDTMSINSEVFVDYSHEKRGLKDSIKQWSASASSVTYDGIGRNESFAANGIFAGDNFSHDSFENIFGDQTIDGEVIRFNAGTSQNEIASIVADQNGVRARRGSPVFSTPQKWTVTTYDMKVSSATAYNVTDGHGWVEENTEQPVDLTSIAVEEIGPVPPAGSPEEDFLKRSYIPMAWSDGATIEDYYWRLDLPNGFYVLELAVGGLDDPEARDYQVDVNDLVVIDGENDPENERHILKRFFNVQVTNGHIKIANGPAVEDPERNIILNKLSWVKVYAVDTSSPAPSGPKTYTFSYDSTRGRLTQDDRFEYDWDEFDRISTVTDKEYDESQPYHPTPRSVDYFYDAMGRRIAYIYKGHTNPEEWPDKRLVYDGIHLIEERNLLTGQLLAKYHYENVLANCPLYVERDTNNDGTLDEKLVVITDDRGTVVGLADESGNIVERAYYNSTGLIKAFDADSNPCKNIYGKETYRCSIPFGRTGHMKDPFTGNYHTHYRDLNPFTTYWLSEDPAGYADGMNLNKDYAGLNGTDPLGLHTDDLILESKGILVPISGDESPDEIRLLKGAIIEENEKPLIVQRMWDRLNSKFSKQELIYILDKLSRHGPILINLPPAIDERRQFISDSEYRILSELYYRTEEGQKAGMHIDGLLGGFSAFFGGRRNPTKGIQPGNIPLPKRFNNGIQKIKKGAQNFALKTYLTVAPLKLQPTVKPKTYLGPVPPKYRYNMITNPGPLAEIRGNPASNFAGGKYNILTLKEDTIFYRGGDSAGSPLGQWFTRTPPNSVANVRIDSAVLYQWIDVKTGVLTGTSPVDTVYKIKIPKGTKIYEGPVGYQKGVYLGGQNQMQIFIETPWKINGVDNLGNTPFK